VPPSPANLVIRAATAADRGACLRLLTAQLREHQLPIDEDGVARAVELALMHGSTAWLVLALADGLVAGILLANPIVSVEHGGPSLWVEELFVVPERRRRGVGRALCEFIVAEARQHGVRAIELEVVPTQKAALSLYRALGFVPSDRIAHVLDLCAPRAS
jgi:GNAT superfamily N-acetyltransferase